MTREEAYALLRLIAQLAQAVFAPPPEQEEKKPE